MKPELNTKVDNLQFKSWFEATKPYVKKIVDPALLTQQEYYNLVNPQDKSHPSNAYSFSIQNTKGKDDAGNDKKAYETLVKTIRINGIDFEFRIHKEDKTDRNYVKSDPDNNILRDEHNNPIYYSKEELEKMFSDNRYDYEIGVFTKEYGYVGGSQDEWGALLIRVADEFRGFGLGPIIGKMARELQPQKSSGGFTPKGYSMFRKVHKEFVKDYLASGMYSHLVNTGQITVARAKSIIDSTKNVKPSKLIRSNLGASNPQDWLLYVDQGSFVLYDKKLKDYITDENPFWREKMIKGMVLTRSDNRYTKIVIFGGDSNKIKTLLLNIAAIEAKHNQNPLIVEPEDIQFLDKNNLEIGEETFAPGYKSYPVSYNGKPFDPQLLGKKEQQFRKKFDKYDEFRWEMVGLAEFKYK